jgi:predicted ATPase
VAEAARPFVSRTAEVEIAESLLLDPSRDRLAVVWLLGEPGIGKTRLATEIACRARSAGAGVLFGRCNEDLSVPYQPCGPQRGAIAGAACMHSSDYLP